MNSSAAAHLSFAR